MGYKIYAGTTAVLPSDNIQQIYAGNRLIWERLSELLADTTLQGYRFTKGGLLAPSVVNVGGDVILRDLTGASVAILQPSLQDNEAGEFLWYDSPLYTVNKLNDTWTYTPTQTYLEAKNNQMLRRNFLPALTDTEAQWSSYSSSIRRHVQEYPTTISGNGGGGVIPLSRPLGYIDGSRGGISNISKLNYVLDGKLVTDQDYVILSVSGELMVCASDIYIATSTTAYGKIDLRDLEGNVIRQFSEKNQRIITYTNPEHPRRICAVGDKFAYYTIRNGTDYLTINDTPDNASPDSFGYNNPTLDAIPENCWFYNGRFYSIPTNGRLIRSGTDALQMAEPLYLQSDAFGSYTIENAGNPGAYYLDQTAGIVYVIGKSTETDKNKKNNYKIFAVKL